MSRTPLARSLRALFTEVLQARRTGAPVEKVHDERLAARARGWTRREVLLASAASAASLMLPGDAFARRRSDARIVIVGGGISGLACALELADRGVASTVYEASGRIGGRMFSNASGYWRDDQVSEWCGELIDTGHRTVRRLADRFKLGLDDLIAAQPDKAEETYYFGGAYYERKRAIADFQDIVDIVAADLEAAGYPTSFSASTAEGRALDAMSIHDWIESRVPGGHGSPLGALLDVAYTIEYGADARDQSALNLLYLLAFQPKKRGFEAFGESDERFHIRGGNQRLPVAIADELGRSRIGSEVRSGLRMTSIARASTGAYRLVFQNGAREEVVNADIVVLALPFAVLRGLDYAGAGFDALKQRAIQELGRGHNGKLQLQFSSRPWNERGPWGISSGSSYSDTGYQASWDVSRGQRGRSGILNGYTGGSVTDALVANTAYGVVSSPRVRADARAFLTQIDPVFPGLRAGWNDRATSSLPHLDPNAQCSYAYWRVGQYAAFAGYEAARQGNVFFAGEHTSTDFQGFMEGGASEGQRAAHEVLDQLRIV